MNQMLTIEVREEGRTTRLVLSGRLDHASSENLRKAIRGVLRSPSKEVLLDVGGLSYLDSLAMGAMLSSRTLLEGAGKKTVLANARGMVLDALRIANFHKLFELR